MNDILSKRKKIGELERRLRPNLMHLEDVSKAVLSMDLIELVNETFHSINEKYSFFSGYKAGVESKGDESNFNDQDVLDGMRKRYEEHIDKILVWLQSDDVIGSFVEKAEEFIYELEALHKESKEFMVIGSGC